jgi:hypothetical protein
MQDVSIFLVENLPDDLKLIGESKFKTPRCTDEKIPIVVFPECTTSGISTFKDKQYLHVDFKYSEKYKFDKLISWMKSLSQKTLYPLIIELDDFFQVKIKLPNDFSVINVDGSESNQFHSSNGSTIKCAVELSCLWETNENIGLSIQMVQCKILKNQQCLIQMIDEDQDYIPFSQANKTQSSGSSV